MTANKKKEWTQSNCQHLNNDEISVNNTHTHLDCRFAANCIVCMCHALEGVEHQQINVTFDEKRMNHKEIQASVIDYKWAETINFISMFLFAMRRISSVVSMESLSDSLLIQKRVFSETFYVWSVLRTNRNLQGKKLSKRYCFVLFVGFHPFGKMKKNMTQNARVEANEWHIWHAKCFCTNNMADACHHICGL